MKNISGLLQLYRIDSFLITIFSFFVTLIITNYGKIDGPAVFLGISLGVVFVNFIYSINSYYDADIDAINKPYRPLPSGKITKSLAKKYIGVLGLLSITLPLVFWHHTSLLIALYSFPVLGILYSNPFYPLKKKAWMATLLTTIIVVLPATLAIIYTEQIEKYFSYVGIIFGYCFCMVPLKDIEDVKGDLAYKSENWAHKVGEKKLTHFSFIGLITLSATAFVYRDINGFILLSGVFACSAIVELYFLRRNISLARLYKALILTNLVLLLTGFIGYFFQKVVS
ncbi:MAG: UbiA family prenyltransferase [Chitinophagales bacterium]